MKQTSYSLAGKYGDNCADYYDELYGPPRKDVITKLHEMANGGDTLELGIGTGRTAIPLIRRGVRVSGIEASPAMLRKLRSKPEGASIPVIMANFMDARITQRFSLIFALCSTIHLLRSHQAQRRCFRTVSKHLSTNGIFLVEASVPLDETTIYTNHLGVDASVLGKRHVRYSHWLSTSSGMRKYYVEMWRSSPAELDLMAQAAKLELVTRWADWRHKPFTMNSPSHISLYKLKASTDAL